MIDRVKNCRIFYNFAPIFTISLIFIVFFFKDANYTKAKLLKEYDLGGCAIAEGNYLEGIDILKELGDYKNSLVYIDLAQGAMEYETNIYSYHEDELIVYLNKLGEMRSILENMPEDSEFKEEFLELIDDLKLQVEAHQRKEQLYSTANDSLNEYLCYKDDSKISEREKSEKYTKALLDLTKIEDYKNCSEMIQRLKYEEAFRYYATKEYMKALTLFEESGNYKDSKEMKLECDSILKRLQLSSTVSAGIRSSAAVTESGGVVFSGEGFDVEDEIATWDDIISVSANGHIVMGLKKDGTVVTAGRLPGSADNAVYRIDTGDWKNIIEIASGQLYIVGLREDGTITAQGHNGDGQVDIDDWHDIVEIACGWRHTVGLDSFGNIRITGIGSTQQLEEIKNAQNEEKWENIVAISAGGAGNSSHTVGLKADGTVVAVGSKNNGQCNVRGNQWTDIVAISAGADHTVGLKKNGEVVTTREEDQEALKEWKDKDIVAIAAGYRFTLGLQRNGKVIGIGYETDGQRKTDNWEDIAKYIEVWNSKF